MGGQCHALAVLLPGYSPGSDSNRGWVVPGASLDRCRKVNIWYLTGVTANICNRTTSLPVCMVVQFVFRQHIAELIVMGDI